MYSYIMTSPRLYKENFCHLWVLNRGDLNFWPYSTAGIIIIQVITTNARHFICAESIFIFCTRPRTLHTIPTWVHKSRRTKF